MNTTMNTPMNTPMNIKDISVITLIMLIIDYIYLKFIAGKPFLKMVKKIQKKEAKVHYMSALFVYLLLVIAMYNYVIYNPSYYNAFMLGSIIYGVFDFTNLALFKNYDLMIGVQDTIWGGLLFTSSKYMFELSKNYV